MAIERLRQTDPVAAPLVAGALAAARLTPTPVAPFTTAFVTPPLPASLAPAPLAVPRRAPGQPIVAPRTRAVGRVLGQPVVALVKPLPTPRPPAAPRPIASRPAPIGVAQPIAVVAPVAAVAKPVAVVAPVAAVAKPVAVVAPVAAVAKPVAVVAPVAAVAKPIAVVAPVATVAPVAAAKPVPVAKPVEIAKPAVAAIDAVAAAAPVVAAKPIVGAKPIVVAKPVEIPLPVEIAAAAADVPLESGTGARGVSITTSGPDSDTGPSTRSNRQSGPSGRRRASRAGAPSIFRVPAGSTTPGSRVAVARRRATAASRRRPLLLSTPIIIAAIIVGGSIGGERLTSASADSSAIAQSADGSTGLGQSDLRVSRQKRDAAAATSEAAPSPTDTTTAATEPLGGAAAPAAPTEPAPIQPAPVAAVAEGGVPAAAPTASVTAVPPAAGTWVRPVEGGSVTSCFCMRWGTFHDGIDIDPPLGTPIASVGDGTVMFAGPVSGYGIGIYIQHIDGSVSFYGHMAIYYVRTGDVVTAGQKIALVGNEGYSTGPHLHFSVFTSWNPNGLRQNAIDPIPWLADRGVTVGGYNPNG